LQSHCSVLQGNGYTVLDLSQFTSSACPTSCFSTGQDLQIILRNTLPNTQATAQPVAFKCSGQAVPFYTAEYTNVDSNGAGLMGPYAPLVSYQVISSLPGQAVTPSLPPVSKCGVRPTTPPALTTAGTTVSLPNNMVQWPTFWQAASPSPQNLWCGNPNQPLSPTINFAASLVPTEDYSSCTTLGACNSVNPLTTQTDAFTAPTAPPMPVTIVGAGFGYLAAVLPFAIQSYKYLRIVDDGHGSGGVGWDTNSPASCQIYIANWTDTTISLVANVPINAHNGYLGPGTFLSPLSDVSPLTFFPSPYSYNVQGCPIAKGDTLTFYVTNPQNPSAGTSSDPVCVGTPGVAPQPCPT
jgi:hypothetical protein